MKKRLLFIWFQGDVKQLYLDVSGTGVNDGSMHYSHVRLKLTSLNTSECYKISDVSVCYFIAKRKGLKTLLINRMQGGDILPQASQ